MAKSRIVTVSALQFACTDVVSTNVDTAERLVRAAHQKGANIILIQELFEGYYFCQAQREDFFLRSKPYKGHPTVQRMQNLATELGVVIPVSFFEEANNAHYNSIVVIDADGTDLGLYRKSHIPDGPGYQEKYYFNPGDTGFKVFQTKFANIGVGICWDQWFPEAARAMVLQGAEVLFYPTAIGSEPQDQGLDSRDHWKRVMQGHAGANLVPLVASNRVGKEIIQTELGKSEITFYGNSFIAGPTGEIVENADDKEEAILIAQFDLDKLNSKRYSWGIFCDRRPDLYKARIELYASQASSSGSVPELLSTNDVNHIYLDAVGGVKKRRIYELGTQASGSYTEVMAPRPGGGSGGANSSSADREELRAAREEALSVQEAAQERTRIATEIADQNARENIELRARMSTLEQIVQSLVSGLGTTSFPRPPPSDSAHDDKPSL